MARKAAPTKNTSGSGFAFEDYVISYFLACLLAGDASLDTEWGHVIRLDFQTRVQDWYLDDLLVTFSEGTRLALSMKSNEQVTAKGLPEDFVSDVWEQYLHEDSQAFDSASDYMGLVTSPLPSKTNEALHEMVRWARDQDEDRFLVQIVAAGVSSATKRNLFSSLNCPGELAARNGVSDKDAVRLLRRLRFLSFDFQSEPSRDLAEAKRRCRNTIVSGSLAEAEELWNHLLSVSSQYRQSGGYVDLPRLLTSLNGRFALKPWPQYVRDVVAISRWTESSLSSLPDKIGLKVRLPRSAEVTMIREYLSRNRFVALTGPSGCGKSVIVKNWIGTLGDVPVLWVDGKTLAQGGQRVDLQHELRLRNPLEEVASSVPSTEAYCIVDGAGIIASEQGYLNLTSLIRALRVGNENSPWRFLLVCQQEEWNRVYLAVSRAYGSIIPWAKLSVEGLGKDESGVAELAEVWQEFPQLRPLIRQPDLRSLLLRPKILDLIATRLALGTDVNTAGWVGESSIALWYWSTEVEKAPAEVTRSQIVRQLAEQQADAVSPQISLGMATAVIDDLVNERVLRYSQGKISFDHDLLGDWSRLQVLIEKQGVLTDFVRSKIVSPFWNRAVRLYGLYLLEQGNPQKWKEALDLLGASASGGSLSQDLILESVIFAASPVRFLEDLWPYLHEDGGKLLRRLLGRFLYTATEPNPRALNLATTPAGELRQSTIDRLPYWPYWLPMLTFLQTHEEEAISLAPLQVSDVANIWLRQTPVDWPGRQEAAGLALAAAEDVLGHEWTYGHVTDAAAELAFSAALAACNEKPDELCSFVLRAAGRRPRAERMRNLDPDRQPVRRQTVPPGMVRRRQKPVPWPDGPLQEPNDEFQKVCFTSSGLFPLIDTAPALAGEVLLALLIRTPHEYDFDGGAMGTFRDMECELSDSLTYHYPPFYWNFPWLYFIRTKPQQAIDTIIRLVNFATERWGEVLHRRQAISPSVSFQAADADRVWHGDGQTYFWYTAVHGPHAVSSVLMTLEFWFYEQLDGGKSLDPCIEQIVQGSRSVAFAGVLASVACKSRSLLHGPLQFLMSVPEFLYLERQKPISISAQTAMIAWSGREKIDTQYALEWHTMAHRKEGLDSVAHGLMLTDPNIRAYFKEVCKEWRKRSKALRKVDPAGVADLERLISAFSPEHYTFKYSKDHKGILITHNLPQALEEQAKPIRERAEQGLLRTTFPMQCRRLLDGELTLTTDEEKNAFWDRCQQILATSVDDSLISNEDCACGAAAVFLLKCKDWLGRHADRLAWSRDQIINTIENPPECVSFDTEVDASEWHWYNFCAAAIPTLWVQDIDSTQLRECMVLMALDHHFRTVGSLFRGCHAERHHLGDQFIKLQALLRLWAMEKIQLRKREDALNGIYVLHRDQRLSFRAIMDLEDSFMGKLLSKDFLGVVMSFVDDTLPAVLPPLGDDAAPEPSYDFHQPSRHERHRNRYAIDAELIQWAYSYLPALDSAENHQERAEWITLWKEILACFLRTLRPASEEDRDKEVGGTPYEVDGWILRSISILVPQMDMAEHPEQFWQPILDLGWQAHHWVENFLSGFFIYNLHKTTDATFRSTFVQTWSSMIGYADSSPVWNHSSATRSWHIGDNWENLIGLNWSYAYPWDDISQPVLPEMQEKLEQFCARHLYGGRMAKKMLRLFRSSAAQQIRLPALLWMEPHFRPETADAQGEADEQLGLFLAECWQSHQEELRHSPKSLDCFMRLVKFLADRQSPLALEIQNRVIAG